MVEKVAHVEQERQDILQIGRVSHAGARGALVGEHAAARRDVGVEVQHEEQAVAALYEVSSDLAADTQHELLHGPARAKVS